MHEKRCDIKQFRLGHTCHFKPLFYLYERGRRGCMIQYHVQATSITNLVSSARFVVLTSLEMPRVWYNCWFIYLNIN